MLAKLTALEPSEWQLTDNMGCCSLLCNCIKFHLILKNTLTYSYHKKMQPAFQHYIALHCEQFLLLLSILSEDTRQERLASCYSLHCSMLMLKLLYSCQYQYMYVPCSNFPLLVVPVLVSVFLCWLQSSLPLHKSHKEKQNLHRNPLCCPIKKVMVN